jgi:glucose-6-phosphate-specific signal transduction histidine kinase
MQLWNLNIVFIEKLTVRDFQAINRLNEKLRLKEIDEISLSNELSKLIIRSINWVYDKEKIEKFILDMDSIKDYSLLNEEIAKRINAMIDPVKKKN